VVIGLFAAGVFSSAYGQMPITSEDPSRLQFTLAPYAWLTGLQGDITMKGLSASPSISFSEIFKDLNIALSSHMEVQKDRWSVYLDPWFAKLSDEGSFGFLEVKMDQYIVEIGGPYRLLNVPIGTEPHSKLGVEGLVGGRYWNTDVHMEFPTFDVRKSKDWFDPIIGTRLKLSCSRISLSQLRETLEVLVSDQVHMEWRGPLIYDLPAGFP
jgi:hypothetical protein